MRKANICFVGAGVQACTNIYPSVCHAGAEIKAIATLHLENSKAALLRFGRQGNPYDNIDEMLKNEECDGVVVAAQPKDMTDIVRKCIKSGKNVFAEKPLGWTASEAAELAEEAEKAGVILMVGFMKRYAPSYLKLKEIILSGELGASRSFNAKFAVNSTAFCKNDEDYIKLVAIHYVDLMRYLFGEVVDLSGFKAIDGSKVSMCFSLKFGNGVIGNVYFSGMDAWSRESENMMITFDKGFVCAEEINKVTIHKSNVPSKVSWQSITEEDIVLTPSATPMSGAYRDLYMRGFIGEMSHFIDCCLRGDNPSSSGRDNVRTMKLCENILSSLK